jgi:hypothetical protein
VTRTGRLKPATRIGRTLTNEDLRQALPNAVISERMWTVRFGRDPAILGRTIVMRTRGTAGGGRRLRDALVVAR